MYGIVNIIKQKRGENMGMKYYRLFDTLNRKEMKKSDLRKILSPRTIAKLSKGESISGETIEKICSFLNCQPENIMEYVPEDPDRNDQ